MISGQYTNEQIEKLGNAIIYLAQNIQPLSKTKALKLLYLIEEVAIKKYGMPFFNISFEVWKLGPVAKEVFIDLSSPSPVLLEKYISTSNDNGGLYINPKIGFDDSEFSELEIEILRFATDTFKAYNAEDLIRITHRENHPWYLTAQKNGLLELFENNKTNSSDIKVDMSLLLEDDPAKKDFYLDNVAHYEQAKNLYSR